MESPVPSEEVTTKKTRCLDIFMRLKEGEPVTTRKPPLYKKHCTKIIVVIVSILVVYVAYELLNIILLSKEQSRITNVDPIEGNTVFKNFSKFSGRCNDDENLFITSILCDGSVCIDWKNVNDSMYKSVLSLVSKKQSLFVTSPMMFSGSMFNPNKIPCSIVMQLTSGKIVHLHFPRVVRSAFTTADITYSIPLINHHKRRIQVPSEIIVEYLPYPIGNNWTSINLKRQDVFMMYISGLLRD